MDKANKILQEITLLNCDIMDWVRDSITGKSWSKSNYKQLLSSYKHILKMQFKDDAATYQQALDEIQAAIMDILNETKDVSEQEFIHDIAIGIGTISESTATMQINFTTSDKLSYILAIGTKKGIKFDF